METLIYLYKIFEIFMGKYIKRDITILLFYHFQILIILRRSPPFSFGFLLPDIFGTIFMKFFYNRFRYFFASQFLHHRKHINQFIDNININITSTLTSYLPYLISRPISSKVLLMHFCDTFVI